MEKYIETQKILTMQEAYNAMFIFLEDYYFRTNADELGGLLGSMTILADGQIADSAIWEDWGKAIDKSLNS